MQPQILPSNTNTNLLPTQNSSYSRNYQQQQQQQQMWSYNLGNSYGPYGPNQPPPPLLQPQQRVSSYNNPNQSQQHYKTPTILRNKDIDDLSKLTDNVTWASASQEVNYEEKIRFSDDEDNDINDSKSRRYNNSQSQQARQTYPQVLQNNSRSIHSNTRSRLLPDDERVKQMQDDKNSELINTLTIAKQRRDEQERHLRDTIRPEQKQIPGYQTRPLITSTGQENLPSSSSQSTTSRTRHDTTDSQTFAMKSWSDQMDSFNYASLHEKSGEQNDNDESTIPSTRKYSRSQSESSSQSQNDTHRSKHFPSTNRKQQKPKITRNKIKTTDVSNYFDHNEQQQQQQTKSNDQWGDWEDSNYQTNNRYQQQHYSNDRRYQQMSDESNRPKQSSKTRSNVSRSSDNQPSSKSENKTVSNNKNQQPAWRALSPTRPLDLNDPTPQEAITYKPKTNDMNDRRQSAPIERKQRYQTTTTTINTSSIPPLMSVRSDIPPTSISSSATTPTTTSKNFKSNNQSQRQDYNTSSHYSQRNDFYNETNDAAWGNDDEYYDDETGYYDPNIPTHQRHYPSHLHHRGYIALGSYGRYRRGGSLRPYNTYNTNNTSSQLNTSTGSKTKKNLINTNNKKTNEPSIEQTKPVVVEPPKVLPDESVKKPPAWTSETKSSTIEEIPVIKLIETPSIPTEIEKPKDLILEQKTENETNSTIPQTDTDLTTTNKKNTSNNSQRKLNKDQQNYHQDQRYQNRHRNTYSRSMQGKDTGKIFDVFHPFI